MYNPLATLLLIVSTVQAFVAPGGTRRNLGVALYSSSAQEFINKQAQGEPKEDPIAQLFSAEVLADIQSCLLTLERRVKEGPGCLSHSELDDFAMAAARVLQDMRDQGAVLDQRVQPGERQKKAEAIAMQAAEQAEREGKTPEEIQAAAKRAFDDAYATMIPPPPEATTAATTAPPVRSVPVPEPVISEAAAAAAVAEPNIDAQGRIVTPPESAVTDDSDDEGPAYDGKGGMGLSRGTANTYIIPGMDEMTADEYQAALAQSVIDRSRQKRAAGSVRGNKLTTDYMASLGSGSNVFGANNKLDDDNEQ